MMTRFLTVTVLLLNLTFEVTDAQTGKSPDYNLLYFYRVCFTDKGSITVSDFAPEDLLSPDAIERREKCGIEPLTESDLPVNEAYINTVTQTGLKFHTSSKWMNSALFSSHSEINPADIE